MSKPIEIAAFAKNRRETLRVALDTYQGTNLVDLRVLAPLVGHATDLIPTKKGVSVSVGLLPRLREALQAAEHKAREMGWLE